MSTSCEAHVYQGITPYKIGVIRQRLVGEGATITGDNPWDADMHSAGVVLHAAWAEATKTLVVTAVLQVVLLTSAGLNYLGAPLLILQQVTGCIFLLFIPGILFFLTLF